MWKDRGSAEWCSTEEREKKTEKERVKGGKSWRQRKGEMLEIKSSGERESGRKAKGRKGQKKKGRGSSRSA